MINHCLSCACMRGPLTAKRRNADLPGSVARLSTLWWTRGFASPSHIALSPMCFGEPYEAHACKRLSVVGVTRSRGVCLFASPFQYA